MKVYTEKYLNIRSRLNKTMVSTNCIRDNIIPVLFSTNGVCIINFSPKYSSLHVYHMTKSQEVCIKS